MLRIVTFGEATIAVDGERIAPSAHRMFALALHLAAERGRSIPRAVVQAELFGDCDERAGSHNLRQIVYRLRRLGAPIVTTLTTLSVAADDVTTDYGALLDTPRLSPEQLEVVAKGFLPGYAPDVSDAYREWVDSFRNRVTLALRRKALDAMAAAHERCDWDAVARAADACLALDPLNEDAVLGRAEALAMSGSKAEALERIERYLSELPSAAEDCRAAARRLRQRIMRRVSEPAPLSLREMPLVGREEEMRRLTSALARTRSEGGGVVLITGEPGIGKTRLLTEFERLAALSGAQTARVVCRASTSHQPLSPFIELTRLLLQMPGALGCSPEALERLRHLCESPSQTVTLPTDPRFNPAEAFTATSAAIVDLAGAVASEATLIVAIDDAQWIDDASNEVTAALTVLTSHAPLLLVLVSRDMTRVRAAARCERITQLRLGPVSADAARTIFRALVHSKPTDASNEARAIERAGGNPLYLNLLATHEQTAGSSAAYPVALSELLLSRLDLLSDGARTLVETCAVLGRHAHPLRVQAVLKETPQRMIEQVRELEGAGLLCCTGGMYAIRHPLAVSLTLETMPTAVRALLHARVARVLQREFRRSRSTSLLWDLADHWERAGDADQAAETFRACVHHSLQVGRSQDVIALIERALNLRGCSTEMRASVLQLAAATYDLLGEWERAAQLASQYTSASGSGATPDTAYLFAMSSRHATGGKDVLGQEKAVAVLLDDSSAPPAKLLSASVLIAYAEDEFEPGLAELARRVVESSADEVHPDWHRDRFWLIYHTCFGSIAEAAILAQRLAVSYLDAKPRADTVNRHFNLAYALVRTDQIPMAKRVLATVDSTCETFGLAMQRVWCRCWEAWIACQEENWHDAQEMTDDARQLASRSRVTAPPMHVLNGVEIALANGEQETAITLLNELDQHAVQQRCARMALHVDQLRARASLVRGEPLGDRQIQELLEGHLKGRAFGMHDDVVATLCEALVASGRGAEAKALTSEYVRSFRRDPFRVGKRLVALADLGPG